MEEKELEIKEEVLAEDAFEVQEQVDQPAPSTKKEIRKAKRDARKAKRRAKLRTKYIEGPDIKFKQPLTYRFLRAFAWVFMFIAQLAVIFNLANTAIKPPVFSTTLIGVLTSFGALTTPLFLFATFAVILSGNKTYKSMIIIYAAGYVGLGLLGIFVFYHYVNPMAKLILEDTAGIEGAVGDLVGQKIQINVFCDLFFLTVVSFFLNYTPKKFFQGKKIIIFRLFVLIPILLLLGAFILKIVTRMTNTNIPFWVYIYLPTKSPIFHMLFLAISFWVKNRKKLFMKIGGTEEEYKVYLKSNRNSLDFSKQLSVLILVFIIIDLVLFVFVAALFYYNLPPEIQEQTEQAVLYAGGQASAVGFGDAISLLFVIPIVMLFSYTKSHKNAMIDTLMPVAAIAVIAILYIEGIYQVLYQFLSRLG